MVWLRRPLAFGLSLCAVLFLFLDGCRAPQPIRIGFVGGLTGKGADLGVEGRSGAQLAVEEINRQGGIGGRPVELMVRDDAQDRLAGERAIRELLALQVVGVVGPMTSAMAEVMVPIAERHRTIMVAPTVTGSVFSGRDDVFLRVTSTTREYAAFHAGFMAATLGKRRAVLIVDDSNPEYSLDWARHFERTFVTAGGEVPQIVRFNAKELASLRGPVDRALAADPDVVVMCVTALDAARIAHLVRRSGSAVQLAAAEWAATEHLTENGGRVVDGMWLTQFYDPTGVTPAFERFRETYQQRYGRSPGFAGVSAYDATMALASGLARLQGQVASAEVLRAALLNGPPVEGLQTGIRFDAYGDALRDVSMTQVSNGRFQPFATRPPAPEPAP